MSSMMMKLAMAGFAVSTTMAIATPASAQATRTWISGVGDDVNPCSRTAPCKTFAGAISKTAAGGEINCIDPAGFGAVTITKSISLICDNVLNGLLVSSGNAINITGTDISVLLSGFDIHGFGSGNTGVRFTNGASLHIKNSTIRGFRGTDSYAINFAPSALTGATLVIDNVTVVDNGAAGGVTGGILIQPGASVPATVLISNSRIADNNRGGIRIDASATGSSVKGTISGSVITDNQVGVYARSVAGGGTVDIALTDSVVSGNGSTGILSESALATINASGNTITQNGNGVRSLTGGNLVSFGDNVLVANNNNGSFTATATKQ